MHVSKKKEKKKETVHVQTLDLTLNTVIYPNTKLSISTAAFIFHVLPAEEQESTNSCLILSFIDPC